MPLSWNSKRSTAIYTPGVRGVEQQTVLMMIYTHVQCIQNVVYWRQVIANIFKLVSCNLVDLYVANVYGYDDSSCSYVTATDDAADPYISKPYGTVCVVFVTEILLKPTQCTVQNKVNIHLSVMLYGITVYLHDHLSAL